MVQGAQIACITMDMERPALLQAAHSFSKAAHEHSTAARDKSSGMQKK